jgi:hypothetical protein
MEDWPSYSLGQSIQALQVMTAYRNAHTQQALQALVSLATEQRTEGFSSTGKPAAYSLDSAVAGWQTEFSNTTLPRWEWNLEARRESFDAWRESFFDEMDAQKVAITRAIDMRRRPYAYGRNGALRGAYNPNFGPALR